MLQQACDCVLSVDIFAACINVWGIVGAATGEPIAIEMCMSSETTIREAVLKSGERDINEAWATARIICGARPSELPRRDDVMHAIGRREG